MRISDWSSDVCSSDLCACDRAAAEARARAVPVRRLDRGRDRPGADEHAGIPPLGRAHRRPGAARPDGVRPRSRRRRALAGYGGRRARDARQAAARRTAVLRSEEHTSELQSLMRTSYAVFCLKKKQTKQENKKKKKTRT